MVHEEVYEALAAVVGREWVSCDPEICQAYMTGGYGTHIYDKKAVPPTYVVCPKNTEEVQGIVRVANRYKVPFIPVTTYYWAFSAPNKPETIMIDLKRMNRIIKIDEKNMYAIVEPFVTHAQLQIEAFKRGLYHASIGSGGQTSVLANTIHSGMGPLGYRIGFNGNRRMLGVEWVLPNGEILRLGSLSNLREYFWGEGPGPDLRGILRGFIGHFGGLGVVTKIAVKLFPFIPPSEARIEPMGITPNTAIKLPENRVKWYNLFYSSIEKLVNAMYEIAKAEIGAALYTVPPMWLTLARSESRTDFLKRWQEEKEKVKREPLFLLRVLLIGYTSEEQLKYEEKVLKNIAAETGAIRVSEGRPIDHSWIISNDSIRVYNVAGGFLAPRFSMDSLDNAIKVLKLTAEMRDKHVPPFLDSADIGWVHFNELGHMVYGEFDVYFDLEDCNEAAEFERECLEHDLISKHYPGALLYPGYHRKAGPLMFNYHLLLERIKKALDPNNVSNPPKPLDNVNNT